MKKFLLIFFVFCFVIPVKSLFAQSKADTLEEAKHLKNKKKFKEAFALLEKYQAYHPNDLNTVWLCAQTAYLIKHFKTSEKEYKKAIQLDPHNAYLLLDYDLMLVNSGDLEKAKPLLRSYYSWDPTNIEVIISLAKISLWQCDYDNAEWFVKKALALNPKNKSAIAIQDEIFSAKSPWGEISILHSSDDQPLQNTTPVFEGSLYNNALSFLHFNFQIPAFITNYNTTNALWFQAGNRSVLSKQNMKINIDLGLLKYPASKNVAVTGNLQLDKTIINHLIFSVQAERKPYFYTLSSLNNVVTDNHYSISASWSNPDKWNGKTAFDLDHFNDKNSISTFSAWCMSPPLKASIAEFRVGYGFNNSTSKENRFVAIKTLSEIIDSSYYHPAINGNYNPYFTPDKQTIHSVIASVAVHPLKTLDIGAKISYGFYAVTQCPYLFLDTLNSGKSYIAKDYFKENSQQIEV